MVGVGGWTLTNLLSYYSHRQTNTHTHTHIKEHTTVGKIEIVHWSITLNMKERGREKKVNVLLLLHCSCSKLTPIMKWLCKTLCISLCILHVLSIILRHIWYVPLLRMFSNECKRISDYICMTHTNSCLCFLNASCYSLALLLCIWHGAHYLDEQWDIVRQEDTLEVILRHDACTEDLHAQWWDHTRTLPPHMCAFKNALDARKAKQNPDHLSSLCSAV